MRFTPSNTFRLILNIILVLLAAYFTVSVFVKDLTADSILAHLALASACIGNLFDKNRKAKILLFIVAVTLIATATVVYILP